MVPGKYVLTATVYPLPGTSVPLKDLVPTLTEELQYMIHDLVSVTIQVNCESSSIIQDSIS